MSKPRSSLRRTSSIRRPSLGVTKARGVSLLLAHASPDDALLESNISTANSENPIVTMPSSNSISISGRIRFCLCSSPIHIWIFYQDGSIHIHDTSTDQIIHRHESERRSSPVTAISLSVVRSIVWIGRADGSLQSWSSSGSSPTCDPIPAHRGSIRAICAGSQHLWTAADDWKLVQRNLDGVAIRIMASGLTWIKCLCLDADRGDLWAGTAEGLRIWTSEGLYRGLIADPHARHCTALAACFPGQIWSGSGDGTVAAWRCADGAALAHVRLSAWITRIRSHNDLVYVIDRHGNVQIGDPATGRVRPGQQERPGRVLDVVGVHGQSWLWCIKSDRIDLMTSSEIEWARNGRDRPPLQYDPGTMAITTSALVPTMAALHGSIGERPTHDLDAADIAIQDAEVQTDQEIGHTDDSIPITIASLQYELESSRQLGQQLYADLQVESNQRKATERRLWEILDQIMTTTAIDARHRQDGEIISDLEQHLHEWQRKYDQMVESYEQMFESLHHQQHKQQQQLPQKENNNKTEDVRQPLQQ